MTRLTVYAPAKLNLGLEILGKRPDGFHEIVTVMQTVTRYDALTVTPAPDIRIAAPGLGIEPFENLAVAAAKSLQQHVGTNQGIAMILDKSIPVAAGLGGASSDAAATLIVANRLWHTGLSRSELADIAASLGSDVPFFLRCGTVFATGRGEQLESLPNVSPLRFVVVAPHVQIPQKTATLYSALTEDDFGTGDRVRRLAQRLNNGEPLAPDLLVNSFVRPLYALRPELQTIADTMRSAGAPFVALSGAGPSHYTAVAHDQDARELVEALRLRLANQASVFACEPVAAPPRLIVEDTAAPASVLPDHAP